MLRGDSGDYQLLTQAAMAIAGVPGLTCEIGLREGGGTKAIVDGLVATHQVDRTHIAIDPYGNIEYQSHENVNVRLDYTNDMRDICLQTLYSYCYSVGVNFIFFNLEDTEFFNRYADGVPVYQQFKTLENQYALVHFDGPHAYEPLKTEIEFFKPRMSLGSYMVFDDVVGYYDHDRVEKEFILNNNAWSLAVKTNHKAAYVRIA